jgi:integrase
LSDKERERLLRAVRDSDHPHLLPMVLIALTTGARRNEVLGLRWRNVDLKQRRAVIEDTKNGIASMAAGCVEKNTSGVSTSPHINKESKYTSLNSEIDSPKVRTPEMRAHSISNPQERFAKIAIKLLHYMSRLVIAWLYLAIPIFLLLLFDTGRSTMKIFN